MSQQQTTKRQAFVESFGETPTEELQTREEYETSNFDGIVIDDTETVMLMAPPRERFETIELSKYEPVENYSMGYVEIDSGIQAVYTFKGQRLTVSADKLETVAELRGETPDMTAKSAMAYRYYPVVIPWDEHHIVIAPILNSDVADDKDDL